MRMSHDEFFVFQQDGAQAHPENNTVAFLRLERRDVVYALVSVYAVHISSTNCENLEPNCHDN